MVCVYLTRCQKQLAALGFGLPVARISDTKQRVCPREREREEFNRQLKPPRRERD